MKCMLWISRLLLVTSLMMNSAGISPAVSAISLSPDKGALNELGQDKKIDATARANAEASYAKRPLSFEANQGQTDAAVKFLARGKGYTLFLTPSEAVLALQSPSASGVQEEVVRMSMKGANANPVVQGMDMLPSKINYMTGDQSKWNTNVKQYSKVQYKQVYKGIDIVYYGNQGQLEYDFVVAPGANPGIIKMNFQGAKSLELDKQGNLVLNLKEGQMTFNAPLLYQKTGDARQPVYGRFVLAGNNQVCFKVGDYDKSKELVIDPTLKYSTYLGTTVEDRALAIAVDAAGNVYMTGKTATVADKFPGTASSSIQNTNGGGAFDAFVIKLNPAGAIVWATYYGGTADDIGLGIGFDGKGKVYITGSTTGNLPSPYTQLGTGGGTEAFVAAFSADGTALVYARQFGSPQTESGNGIVVDAAGNAYVTGFTGSTANDSFPVTAGAAQTTFGGAGDAFVSKFDAAGNLAYSTYLGGTGIDRGNAIAIDSIGNAYITGQCEDAFVSVATYPDVFKNTIDGASDAFIVKLNPSGSTFTYKTYIGGASTELGTGIVAESENIVYITGDVGGAGFPGAGFVTVGQTAYAGGAADGFVFKINMFQPGGKTNDGVYATYLGGGALDNASSIVRDPSGNVYVTGRTTSGDFVSVAPASEQTPLKTVQDGTASVFVSVVSPDGKTRLWKTFIGGVTDQQGQGISLDAGNNIYVAGWTNSTDFPTAVPLYAANAGSFDCFVMKISSVSAASLPAITSVNPTFGTTAGGTSVIIYGTGFNGTNGVAGVKFGTVNAASYVLNSSTMITAVSPAQVAGLVDIRVTNPAGTTPIVAADQYTYYALPVITGVIPPGGVPAGGTTVVITGTGFTGITSVKFDISNATSFTVDSNTQITAVSPAHAVGIVHITATNPVGTSTTGNDDLYTYATGTSSPTITGITPKVGTSVGGTTVVITGTGFTGITAANGVKFGAFNAASYVVNSDTKITAVTKAHAVGIVDVRVTSIDGISPNGLADDYTYFLTPVVGGAVVPFEPYIFPSPTRGNTANLAYYMQGPGLVDFRIYNEIGELVKYLLDESKPAGVQGSSINVGKMASGVYYCLLNINYDDGTKKHYKLKFVVIH